MNVPWLLRAPHVRLAPAQVFVIVAVALTGATLGFELVRVIPEAMIHEFLQTPAQRLWVAGCTGMLSGCLAALATRAETLGGASALCLLALPAAVANTILCLLGAAALKGGFALDGVTVVVMFGAFYGVILGGPCGIVLGFAYAWPIVTFVRARRGASLDALDRVLSWTGGWALVMGAGAAGLGLRREQLDGALVADVALFGLGALAFLAGAVRRALRTRWLRAVRQGLVPDFDIVPREAVAWDADGALPFAGDQPETCDALLVRVSVAHSAYRTARVRTVCARVSAS